MELKMDFNLITKLITKQRIPIPKDQTQPKENANQKSILPI